MKTFKLGTLVMTRGIKNATDETPTFTAEILKALDSYKNNDWGDICDDDKEMNNEAIDSGNMILAAYQTSKGRIYIITEWDRSVTTVMFCNEY